MLAPCVQRRGSRQVRSSLSSRQCRSKLFLRFVVPLRVAADLDRYTAVFSSNMPFPGLFISPKCYHTAAFPFVLIAIITSSGATILEFVTRRLL